MSWPLSQDFNEAVQNPGTAFADADLRSGRVTSGPLGVPLPRSGNYADVYQVIDAHGTPWAVKCFTRPTQSGLAERYRAIADYLKHAQLPFSIAFDLLPEGIRVRNRWYPIVKMQWVEGLPINQFVKTNLGRATILENMLNLWVRLCRRMRETGMAHCDLQHGNVLLVPAESGRNSLGLKLVDYDGMYVPALKNQPSGEYGHASYQHPERIRSNLFSPDLDRFPHLVVVTALRALLVTGQALWDRYDNGDNLLFTERDFAHPGQSRLFRELWDTGDAFTVGLVAQLALSCVKPLSQTPWVDMLMPGGQPPVLTPSQERQAAAILGISIPVSLPGTQPVGYAAPAPVSTQPALLPTFTKVSNPTPPPLPALEQVVPAVPALSRTPAPVARRVSSVSGLIVALGVGCVTFAAIVAAVIWLVGPQFVDRPTAEAPSAVSDPDKNVTSVASSPVAEPSKPVVEPELSTSAAVIPPPSVPVVLAREIAPAPTAVPEPPKRTLPVVAVIPRLPVPDEAQRLKAEQQIREKLKVEYSRKSQADRRKLAERLQSEAGSSLIAAERYVSSREWLSVAEELQDPALAMQAIDAMGEFAINVPREKQTALEKITSSNANSNLLRASADVAIEQAELLVEKDDYASSLKFLDQAIAWLNQAGAHVSRREVETRQALWKQHQAEFVRVKQALTTLQMNVDDPKANRIVGRFRGFTQGRWEDASDFLLASGDSKLQQLGKVESRTNPDPEATDLMRAEIWEAYASTANDADRVVALTRARHWYGRALTSLSDVDRAKAEDKLSFRLGDVEYRPGILAEIYALPGPRKVKGRIDPLIDIQTRDFRKDVGLQVQIKWSGRLLAPVPGKYKLIAETSDAVRVTLGSPGEERALIESKTGTSKTLEAVVNLSENSRPITIAYFASTDPRGQHGLVLKWLRPGMKTAEPVPMHALFWASSDKSKLKP